MKKNLRRTLAILLSVMMASMALTACSGSSDSSDTGDEAEAETTAAAAEDSAEEAEDSADEEAADTGAAVTSDWEGAEIASTLSGSITYMHSGDDYEREMYATVFDGYMQYAPDVKVEQMYVPSDYTTKVQTLAAADDLPDLFWVAESGVREYADAGLLTSLDEYMEQYPALTDDIVDGVLDFGNIDGVQYAFPKDWTSYVMYLNLDAFEEAGVEVPDNDWTVEDYEEIAAELTKLSEDGSRTDMYGTAINNYRADWINWMGNYEADWFQDGKSNLSSPEALQGLSVMYDLVQAGSAPSPGTVSATSDSEDRLFITGKVAMYPSGRWVTPSFREECDFDWDCVEMPTGTTKSCPFICSMVCIADSSENKDIAANLLSYQMSDEGLLTVMSQALSLPVYNHLMEDERYVDTPPSPDALINSASYLGNESQIEACLTGKWSEYSSIIEAYLSDAFEGVTTIEEAAEGIDEQANNTVFTD